MPKTTRKAKPKKLSPKIQLFIHEYLVDLNGKQAAIRAGYSEKTAESQASRLLRNVKVAEAIEKAMAARIERVEITGDMVVKELAKIGFADIRKAVAWGINPIDDTALAAKPNGLGIYPVSLVPSEVMDADTAAAVSEVSLTQTGVKIKMYDKKGALDSLGKHFGIFEKDNQQTAPAVPSVIVFKAPDRPLPVDDD